MKQRNDAKLLGLRLTDDEERQVNALLLADALAKNVPVNKSDLLREAIDLKAKQVIGRPIFQGQQ